MKFSPSTSNVSIVRKCEENFKTLQAILESRQRPMQLNHMFDQLEEYDRYLLRYTATTLAGAKVFEIGYGARPWRLIALMSMGVDASGVDAEVPFLSGGWREICNAFRRNGMERVLKSFGRRILSDRREKSELTQELGRRGYGIRIEASRLLVSDAAKLNFPDRMFDLIFSEDVFEHISRPSLEVLVPKMSRWLKSDGLALIRPNIFTGIRGGHLAEWSYSTILDCNRRRKSAPWEHLRARRFLPNTFLNELTRSEYRVLFSKNFDIIEEVVALPDLGREFLTDNVAVELAHLPEEELFSNQVLFVLQPKKS